MMHAMDHPFEEQKFTESDRKQLAALKVPVPIHEHHRLAILRQCNLLDTPNDESFDRFVSLAHRYFKVPIVLISLMDVNRQWFKSRIGLEAPQTHRDAAFCAYTLLEETPRVMIVPDANLDNRFRKNPLVLGSPYIRFYAGASIIVEGLKVATLCLIDTVPHDQLSKAHESMLIEMADAVSDLISARRQQLLEERFNGVFMHQSVLTVIQDPLYRAQNQLSLLRRCLDGYQHDFQSISSYKELLQRSERLQRQVVHLGRFLDDALRVLARVILHNDQLRHESGEGEDFLSCNALALYHSIKLALQEANIQHNYKCDLINNAGAEDIKTHADMLLICFTALLHVLCDSQDQPEDETNSSQLSSVELIMHEDSLAVTLHASKEFASACEQRVLLPIRTMLAWVKGSVSISESATSITLQVPRFQPSYPLSARSTALESASFNVDSTSRDSTPMAAIRRKPIPFDNDHEPKEEPSTTKVLTSVKSFGDVIWSTLSAAVSKPPLSSSSSRKVTPEPSVALLL